MPSVHLSLSPILGAPHFLFQEELSVFSLFNFSLLSEQTDNFQVPSMWNLKLNVSSNIFCHQYQIIFRVYVLKHFNTLFVG